MTSSGQDRTEIDMEHFHQVFFEECAEHLGEMERILLGLSGEIPDREQLNAIFRAAHSIKGGAGIFGFLDMTVVTHALESLLDRIRNDEIPFSAAMVDLFLEAGDVIAMQLSGHRHGREVSREDVDRISRRLQQVMEGDEIPAQERAAPSANIAVSPAPAAPAGPSPACRRYELEFVPDPDIFRRGVRIEGLFAELRELGELTINAELSSIPDFSTFDPESCNAFWRLGLVTTASEDEIRGIFEFVADSNQLAIRVTAGAADNAIAAGKPPLTAEGGAAEFPLQGENPTPSGRGAPGANGARAGEADSSIRVGITKVDQLINQVGELVITQAMLAQAASGLDPVLHENLHRTMLQLERNTRSLQQSVMSIRLVPISVVFSRYPRMVRELAAKLGKQVRLKTMGDSTELDKGLIEKITDPLTHLIRNCMDHALEAPQTRVAAGKDPTGTIVMRASQVGGRIIIEVIDDGAGLDRARILRKAGERGIPASDAMSDEEVWQLIFTPGFSTAEAVSDISGRGVGMDVVQKNVQSMGGRVTILSDPGRGTRVTVSLPLTLAILDGLSVAVGDEKFIIPLNAIVESIQPKSENLKSVSGKTLLHVRDEYIQLVPLHELFNLSTAVTEPEDGILVLVDVDGEKIAILVDALLDELQVVIKSIEENYRKVEGTAGATILGDGRVALILDVNSLLQMHNRAAASSKERNKEVST